MSLNAVLYQSAALLYISGDRCESPLPFMESSPIFLVFQSNAKHTCSEQLYVTRKNVFFLNLVKASMESTFAQGRRSWDVESAWTARRAVRSKSSCALCNMRANVNLAGKFSGMFRIPVVDVAFWQRASICRKRRNSPELHLSRPGLPASMLFTMNFHP